MNMKKFVLCMAAAGGLTFSSTILAWGLSWESFTGMGREAINPVAYNIEVSGNNLRVYEWITPTSPQQKCVFVASEHNTNLQCDEIAGHSVDVVFEKVNEEK